MQEVEVAPGGAPGGEGGQGTWAVGWWWLVAPLLTVAAFRAVGQFEFVGDARFLIADNLQMRDLGSAWGQVTHNYFWSSSGNMIPYWRPLTKLSWLLEYQLWGPWVPGFLLVQVGWHLLGVLGVQLLGRQLALARPLALLAGLVYGLHPVAVAPVCLLMARSDVVAAACAVWAALAFRRWHLGPAPRLPWLVLHLGALTLALASKEAAVALPLLCLAWTQLEPRRAGGEAPEPRWRAAGRSLPAVGLAALYLLLRARVLQAEAEGLGEVVTALDPLRLFAGLSVYLQNLWPLLLRSGVRDISAAEAASAGFALGGALTLAGGAALLAWAGWRRDGAAVALLLWVGLVLGPVLLARDIHVPGADQKYPLADRWLVHALAPAALLWLRLGAALLARVSRPGWRGARLLLPAALAGAAVWTGLVLHGSRAAALEFGTEAGLLDNEDRAYYLATPARFRTRRDHCRHHERRVVRAQMRRDHRAAERLSRDLIRGCGPSPERTYWRFSALVQLGRLAEAEPLARALVQRPPADRRSHALLCHQLGLLHLKRGRPAEARRWLTQALKLGGGGCGTFVLLAEAARALGQRPAAAEDLVQAHRCGRGRDPSLLLAAATLLLQAGQGDPAARLLGQLQGRALSADQQDQLRRLRRALADPTIPRPGLPGAR